MKRASANCRLQLIKEVVTKKERESCSDPMARRIHQLLDDGFEQDINSHQNQNFIGCYFDENIGGWVNNNWKMR